jgi:AraC-like DNA-binding protein
MASILIDPAENRRILDFRPLGFRDVLVLGRYDYAAVHRGLDEHCHHKMLEICYLERGQQTYFVGQERFDLTGGDVFLTFPGERHGTGRSPEGKGVLYWMLVRMPERGGRFLVLPSAMGRQLADALRGLPARHFRAGDLLGKTLRSIVAAYDRADDPLRKIAINNRVLRFLLEIVEASGKSRPRVTPTMEEVRKFVLQNIDCPLSVRQLARLASLSEPRFKARFKKELGISPADYVARQKIERARSLLQSDRATITEVAMQLGFSTAQYFATVFRRYTGQTPSQYRRQRIGIVS